MKVTVRVARSFKVAAKPLLKKYPSLSDDLVKLESGLTETPALGTPLGHSAYKIRLKITSKGKGKSGGARVISFIETVLIGEVRSEDEETTVNLLTIYDKADTATITDKELKELISSLNKVKG